MKIRVFNGDNEIAAFDPNLHSYEFKDGDVLFYGTVEGAYGRHVLGAFARGTWTFVGVMA